MPNAQAIGFEDRGDNVSIATADGRTFDGPAVVAADGVRSLFRQKIIGDGEPRPVGYAALRTIVPMRELKTEVPRDAVVLWAGPGYHVVHYPLRHGAEFNIVAVFRTSTHAEKADAASYRAELEQTYRDAHPAIRELNAMMDFRWRRSVADRAPVRHWHKGCIVLLGDAAHAPLQSLAQGACMAIEDAVCLSHAVAAASGDHARAFEAYKRKRLLVDYDDLLVRFRELLETDEGVRRRIADSYRYIMVDEYQDTNLLQAEIVRKAAFTHDNVMVVGDDSQSIYGFRGATFRNIMDFPKLFPGTQIFKLEENYRSTQPILTLANEVINQAAEKYAKTLFTRKCQGPAPVLITAADENTQSRFVAQRVLELREEGVPLADIAVLFRSSFHSFDLEIELSRRNIPFVKRGGFKFIETAHVKDVLAHLRVVENPRDAVSWNRLLLLLESVGPKKSQALIESILAKEANGLDALREASAKGSGPGAQGLQDLVRVLEEVSGGRMTPAEQMNAVCGYYLPILKQHYDDYPKRIKDVEHLYTIAARYGKLESFLADLALEPPDESVFDVEAEDRDDERLVLSTIHSAKGLEWHSVFIIWALDGKFPSVYSMTADDELEEERRLFYVAITRAKQNLYVSYPVNVYDKPSGMVLSKPSRFLDEVRRDCLETWSLVDEDAFN